MVISFNTGYINDYINHALTLKPWIDPSSDMYHRKNFEILLNILGKKSVVVHLYIIYQFPVSFSKKI